METKVESRREIEESTYHFTTVELSWGFVFLPDENHETGVDHTIGIFLSEEFKGSADLKIDVYLSRGSTECG